MDLIKNLEQKFKKINIALNNSTAKPDLIKNRFKNDLDQIQNKHLEPAPYETGLNESRDEMLKQLIIKRNEQLKQVDDFFQASPAQLTNLAESIKPSYIALARSLISVSDSILSRTKFEKCLNACQLMKYSSLLASVSEVKLKKLAKLYKIDWDDMMYKISPSLVLVRLGSRDPKANEDYLSILSMKGAALHVKTMKYDTFSFKVNATSIVVHYSERRLVEVYNFKLKLLHFFSLDKIHRGFTLSANYEIFFFGH